MRWLGQLFRRGRRYDDISVMIRAHLEETIEELTEGGMPRHEAERAARHKFGNVALIEERSREMWQFRMLEQLWADLKFSWRQAVRSPRFTLAAVATLAIGIGAQATIYSVIYAVLIDPYPYRGAMRMVHLHLYDKDPFPDDLALSGPQFDEFEKSPVLDGALAGDWYSMALTGEELPEKLEVGRLSPNAFEFFGVAPLVGREFAPSDSSRVAVLAYHFWKSHFASRADVIGKPLQLDKQNYTIVGVMPERFAWMGSDAYVPLVYSTDPHRVNNVYARVRPGVSDHAAEQALQPMLDAFAKETPANFPQKFKVHLVHINEIAIGRFRGALVILFVSVSFLLALACVNVAILLLARGEARQAEIAVRKALGASRGRILAQLLCESLLLSAAGGAAGVLLSVGGIRLVTHFSSALPTFFPPEARIALNLPVVGFSVGIALVTGVVCGLWPAMRLSRTDLRRAADAAAQRLAGRKGNQRAHMVLLSGQIALTILLLACSGATVRKLSQLIHANLGYEPRNLFAANLVLREGSRDHWAERVEYYEQIRASIAADPNVVSAAIGSLPPMILDSTPVMIPGQHGASGRIIAQQVSPEFFSTIGIPLLSGRAWTGAESAHAARLAVINESMRRRYWPGSDPMGQTLVLNNGVVNGNVWKLVAPGDDQRFQIIGVVGDSANKGLGEEVSPAVYLPYSMTPLDGFDVVVRTHGDAPELLRGIKEAVHRVDPGQAVGDLVTATQFLEGDSLGRERFIASLFTAFAFLGLAFAVSGLYCVQSYIVALRTPEFGVRIALGAGRLHLVALVTRTSAIAVVAGTIVGIIFILAMSQVFAHWTNGNARDPQMLVAVVGVLFVAALLASVGPAVVTSSIAPTRALRAL